MRNNLLFIILFLIGGAKNRSNNPLTSPTLKGEGVWCLMGLGSMLRKICEKMNEMVRKRNN